MEISDKERLGVCGTKSSHKIHQRKPTSERCLKASSRYDTHEIYPVAAEKMKDEGLDLLCPNGWGEVPELAKLGFIVERSMDGVTPSFEGTTCCHRHQ